MLEKQKHICYNQGNGNVTLFFMEDIVMKVALSHSGMTLNRENFENMKNLSLAYKVNMPRMNRYNSYC